MSSLSRLDAVETLKTAISGVLQVRSSLCIHKKKFAALCQFLDNFRLTLMQMDSHERSPTDGEESYFKTLFESLNDLKNYFQGFTAASFINSLCERSVESTNQFIHDFSAKFNAAALALKLSEISPIPNLDAQFEVIAHSADIEDIHEKVEEFLAKNEHFENASILRERLAELDSQKRAILSLEESQKRHEDDQRRIMSQSEIEEALKPFSKWYLRHSDLKQQRRIGSGAYSEVYVGYQKSTKRVVAIKKLHAQKFSVAEFELFRREIEILSQLNHFAILSFVGVCISPPYLIMTEFMSGGCLFDWLRQPVARLDPTKLTIVALGVACGMAYLHSKHLLHRDIKSMNILLDADGFPKICDFGMSRWRSQDDNILTSGVGTSQWMAPEVLNLQPYSEKADVYSYGILLWEMLSRDIPFRGMKDIQIAMAVIHHGSRPLMPQDAPPKLAKLIERCWNRDPEVRPDFPTIVRAFTSGEMAFPGANHEMVMAYLSKNSESMIKDVLSDVTPASILNDLASKPEEGIAKLGMINGKEEWKEFLESSELVETLINLVNRCDNAQFAEGIIQAVSDVIKLPESFQKFTDWNGPNAVMKLILKFATTTMGSVMDFLSVLTRTKVVIFNEKHLSKITAFLLANDITTRVSTVTVILQIVNTKAYEGGSDLNVFVPNILINMLPETMKELLTRVLDLLHVLIEIEGINIKEITEALLMLLSDQMSSTKAVDTVCESCLGLLKLILSRNEPSDDVVAGLLKLFVPMVDRGYVIDSLKILAFLTKSFSATTDLTQLQGVFHCLSMLIEREDITILICTLKLIYVFVTNPATSSAFEPRIKDILGKFLMHDDANVSCITAAIATVYIQQSKSLVSVDLVVAFLKRWLADENQNTLMALRLAGAMSSFLAGAMRLEHEGIYEMITNFIQTESKTQKHLVFMILAAASSSFPLSQAMISSIPAFFELLQSGETDNCLIFLANIALNEKGALACAPKLDEMIDMLAVTSDDNVFRILTLISRILATGSCNCSKELLTKLVTATKTMWQSPHSSIVFQIYESMSLIDDGKAVLSESGLKDFIFDKLSNFPKAQQAQLLQILSRLPTL